VGAGSELVTANHGVKKMLYLGAPLTPDQAKSVVDYRGTNYSAGKS
jgi:hypothetical protein